MNQFVAPQFIDVEDRIIGPITTRQFIMMVIGGVFVFLAYKLLDMGGFLMVTLTVIVIVLVFGFIKINGRRFHDYMGSMIEALKRPKIRVWRKRVSLAEAARLSKDIQERAVEENLVFQRKRLKAKHLAELSLLVDTGGLYLGEIDD